MALLFSKPQNDTIAAIATAASEAGIGIIRISGPEAVSAAGKLYRTKSGRAALDTFPAGTIHFGYIVDPESEEIIDEVMVSVMRAPHSYTTEDTVEINTHGGVYLMQKILELVLRTGVRGAEPGEFTRRAFLGGRIDLSQAEAVMDLISAQSEFSRKTAIRQLKGSVADEVKSLREQILYEIAFIESALDDPENYSMDGYPEKLDGICKTISGRLRSMIAFSKEGRIIQEGIRTVIVGRPNTGKSSLLNILSGYDRAIVTDIAGTTRDTLEETVRIGDAVLRIVDTAGIRQASDEVEKIGVERALRELESAQLILFVIDSSEELTDEDRQIAEAVKQRMQKNAKCIVLMNKTDLVPEAETSDSSFPTVLQVSMKTGSGLQELKNTIGHMFRIGEIAEQSEVFLSNARQLQAAENALESLQLVSSSIHQGLSEDFFSIDLQNAYAYLGEIIGESVEDDLVEEIFSRFCLGK